MSQLSLIEVGKILKERGLKGEFKLIPFTDDIDNFKCYSSFFIKGKRYQVEYFKNLTRFLVVKLKGIDNVNEAIKYKNSPLMIDRSCIPANEILIEDYLNLEVINEKNKKKMGIVSDYIESSLNGLFKITLKNKSTILVPASLEFFGFPNLKEGWVYLRNHQDIIGKDAL